MDELFPTKVATNKEPVFKAEKRKSGFLKISDIFIRDFSDLVGCNPMRKNIGDNNRIFDSELNIRPFKKFEDMHLD